MPPSNLDIELKIAIDDMNIHRAAGVDNAPVEVKNIWLCYDKLILNPMDTEKSSKMLKTPTTVNYLTEMIFINPGLMHKQCSYVIVNNVLKPRHLFIFFSYTENNGDQLQNSFGSNTSDLKITNANLRLNDNTYFPGDGYDCANKPMIPFLSLLKYMNEQNTREGVFINYDLFKTSFMYLYFNI